MLTLHADVRGRGVGTALIAKVKRVATHAGCNRLWVITTNDNVDALRFYQRRGFRLAALHRGAVDEGRVRLKPEIPGVGDYRIPLRDELELEQELAPAAYRGRRGRDVVRAPYAESIVRIHAGGQRASP